MVLSHVSTLNKPCNWLLCTTLVKPLITSPVGETAKTDVVVYLGECTQLFQKFKLQVMSGSLVRLGSHTTNPLKILVVTIKEVLVFCLFLTEWWLKNGDTLTCQYHQCACTVHLLLSFAERTLSD